MDTSSTQPLWLDTPSRRYPALHESMKVDVVIVGGGVTGLTAAYLAAAEGKRVCLLERKRLIQGETGHTTAHLTGMTDARLGELVSSFGEAGASLGWFAGFFAIEEIARIAKEEKIECDFRRVDGYLHESLTGQGDGREELLKEVELANKLGFEVAFVERTPIVHKPGMRIPQQGLIDPAKYLSGLAEAIVRKGGNIFEESEVTSIEGEPLVVSANGHRIECEKVMIATHVPLMGKTSLPSAVFQQSKLTAYSTYVVSGRLKADGIEEVSLWDTSDPYFYLRTDRLGDSARVIFGGCDHKTGQVTDTQQHYASLEAQLRAILPEVQVDHRWSGQVIPPMDGLPYIGETTKGQFAATGYDGNGMTFGTVAAVMFRDYLIGQQNPWRELFSPERTIFRSGIGDYLKENLSYPYYMIADRLKRNGKAEVDGLKAGEGKIIDRGTQKIACSRDQEGRLHEVSAICTHMGCVVHWNNGEQTWDCPCHGSRFLPDGSLIAGPAETPLKAVAEAPAAAS
jgi:glycine/D-amino acid oxidase-like deaminating enzyme/nitrite reductase/ring-hydroxylating ferredoxin subunit